MEMPTESELPPYKLNSFCSSHQNDAQWHKEIQANYNYYNNSWLSDYVC